MRWYDRVEEKLESAVRCSHKDLIDVLKTIAPAADSTCHRKISRLVKEGNIVRTGYDSYTFPDDSVKPEYRPMYSDLAEGLKHTLSKQ